MAPGAPDLRSKKAKGSPNSLSGLVQLPASKEDLESKLLPSEVAEESEKVDEAEEGRWMISDRCMGWNMDHSVASVVSML